MTWRRTLNAALLVASSLIAWAVYRGSQAGATAVCRSNLYQVAWCVLHSDRQGRRILPPATARDERSAALHSWRTFAAEIADMEPVVTYTYSEPWNSPGNERFAQEKPFGRLFACPHDRGATCFLRTDYVAVVGAGTLWRASESRDLSSLGPDIGQKILLLEIPRSDILWTEPRDISLETALQLFTSPDGLTTSRHSQGLHFITVDLQIRPVASVASLEEFRSLLCVTETSKGSMTISRAVRGSTHTVD